MAQTKIGITGATGQLGQKVIENLKKAVPAEQIVALVRNPQKVKDFGVEVREFDYNSDALQLGEALKGISKLLLISSSENGKRVPQHKNVIDGAKNAGVPYLAYTSVLRADVSALSLAPEHKETENYLKESGLDYTFLRNGWYVENQTASIGGALQSGAVYGSSGEGKISAATRNDFAKAAVKVLTTEGHENKVYELGGSITYTLADYAAEIAKQSGKDIKYIHLSGEEYAKYLEEQAGFPAPVAQMLAGIDLEIAKGELEADSATLESLVAEPLETLEDAVREALKSIQ